MEYFFDLMAILSGLVFGFYFRSRMWHRSAFGECCVNYLGKWHKVIKLDPTCFFAQKIGYFCTQCHSLCEHFDEGITCDCSDKRWESEVILPADYPEKWVKVDMYITKHNAWTT